MCKDTDFPASVDTVLQCLIILASQNFRCCNLCLLPAILSTYISGKSLASSSLYFPSN